MVRLNRSVLGKTIFGISVVAITATVGVTGFANAARPAATPAANGYGGTGARIQAAIQAFEDALHGATSQYEADIASCVAGLGVGSSATADTAFSKASTTAASDFSAQTANPTAFSSVTKFDQHFGAADTALQGRLDTDTTHLVATLDRNQVSAAKHTGFIKCLNTARHTYRNAISAARAQLRAALRGIFS